MKKEVVAILCSDLHLSSLQPACRADKDWLATQAEYLGQLADIADESPILCAGDIFDRWNPTPELINFALTHLPKNMWCIPGQHDLPNHDLEQIHRSGYGVLVEAGKIKDLSPRFWQIIPDLPKCNIKIFGYPWGSEIGFPEKERDPQGTYLKVALIHKYCWKSPLTGYKDAPKENHVGSWFKNLKGFDVAVVGDNHIGFETEIASCQVFNCGGFMRRKSDEINHHPRVGRLWSDGSVTSVGLDTSKDRIHENPVRDDPATALDMQDFIRGLEELGDHGMDFAGTVKEFLEKNEIRDEVKILIRKALEKS